MSLLPACPSCGQSVLDDDATECPFCGAAMKGKPGAKPAPSAPKSAAPAKKAAEPKKAAANDADEDPFGVTSSFSARKAIQLLAKPGKGKLFRVLCPMCESPGFWSKDCIGKEVRCSNEKCLMPLFTAPDPDAPPVDDKPAGAPATGRTAEPVKVSGPKKPIPKVVVICGGVVVVGGCILGGALWMSSQSGKQNDDLSKPMTLPVITSTNNAENPNGTPESGDNKTTAVKTPAVVVLTADELRADGFKKMIEAALDPEKNTQKPYCRRMVAESYALTGKLDAVKEHIDQIEKIGGSQLKYFGLIPTTLVGWKHIEAGRAAEAKASADVALELMKQAPELGTMPLEAAIELSSLLVALDRVDEAKTLISSRQNALEAEQQVESLLRAEAVRNSNLDQLVKLRPAWIHQTPWVSVTFLLTMRGQTEKALAWARSAPTPEGVADCLGAFTEALAWSGTDLAVAQKEIATLPPARKANVLARLAHLHHVQGKADLAKTELQQAVDAHAAITIPAAPTVPDMKGLYSLSLPDVSQLGSDALASSEVAHAQAAMGQTEAAWKTLTKCLDLIRSSSPSPALAEQPANLIKQLGDTAIQNDLKSLLKLKSKDEAEAAFRQYRKNCATLADSAALRMDLESKLLEAACGWGLVDAVWTEISARVSFAEATGREPWFDTQIPSVVHSYYKSSGQAEKADAVEKAATTEKLNAKRAHRAIYKLEAESVLATEPARAAQILKGYLSVGKGAGDTPWLQDLSLQLVSRLVTQDKLNEAFQLARAVDDPVFRNTVLELIAMQATRAGKATQVRDAAVGKGLTPPDRVAILRGYVPNLPAK